MDSPIILDLWGPNCTVKDVNGYTNYTGDLFVVVEPCIEPATLFEWANDRNIVNQCTSNISQV